MKKTCLLFCVASVFSLLVGCAAQPQVAGNKKVLVYPLYDLRKVKAVDFQDCLGSDYVEHPVSSSYLGKITNSTASFAVDSKVQPNFSFDEIPSLNGGAVKVANNGEDYVLAIALRSFKYLQMNTVVSINLEGYLVQVDNGKVIWHDTQNYQQYLGLLGGSLDKALGATHKGTGCSRYGVALSGLLESIPKLPPEGEH